METVEGSQQLQDSSSYKTSILNNDLNIKWTGIDTNKVKKILRIDKSTKTQKHILECPSSLLIAEMDLFTGVLSHQPIKISILM